MSTGFVTLSGGGLSNIIAGTSVLTQKGFYDFDFKASCRIATDTADDLSSSSGYTYSASRTITKNVAGVVTIDGINNLAQNDRILVKNQTVGSQNGIYKVFTVGDTDNALVLVRSEDCDTNIDVTSGLFVHIEEGTANSNKNFALTTNNPIDLGNTSLNFEPIFTSGGGGTQVADGGTGASSFTDGGVLLGSGTNPITAMGVLGSGTIIVGDGSGDPFTMDAFTGSGGMLHVHHGGTGTNTFTNGGVLLGNGTGAITAMAVLDDGEMIVGDGTTNPVAESGDTLRTSIGVGSGNTPEFTGIELGDASDTTLTRASSGDVNIEGNIIYRAGGTDVPITDGGTGASTASVARTNLGLGSIATYNSNNVSITGGSISGIVDLPVADGGTGASTASGARSNLGLGTAAVASTGISNTNVPVFTSGVADNDFLRVDGTSIEGRSAAEVLTDLGLTTAEVATGVTQFTTTALASTAEAADGVLTYDHSAQTIKYHTFASVCFLKGTKITLPDYSQKNIEDLTLADDVLTYNIDEISNIKDKNVLKNVQLDSMNGKISQSGIRNIWINPTDSYLIINDKLKVTKNHIIHFKRDNQYYFRFADHLTIGDELMNDKEVYESVESIEEINEKTNVYNFELDKDNTYFAENYLVHHYCELCSGYSKII